VLKIDLDKDPGFAPGRVSFRGGLGFNLAFGFSSRMDLDPKIGTWEIKHVTRLNDGSPKTDKVFPLTRCKDVCEKCEDDPENKLPDSCGWTSKDYSKLNMEEMYCTDVFDEVIKGGY
jgi:hypothetical protein